MSCQRQFIAPGYAGAWCSWWRNPMVLQSHDQKVMTPSVFSWLLLGYPLVQLKGNGPTTAVSSMSISGKPEIKSSNSLSSNKDSLGPARIDRHFLWKQTHLGMSSNPSEDVYIIPYNTIYIYVYGGIGNVTNGAQGWTVPFLTIRPTGSWRFPMERSLDVCLPKRSVTGWGNTHFHTETGC